MKTINTSNPDSKPTPMHANHTRELTCNPEPVCPWCGDRQQDAWELGLGEDGESCVADCDSCGKFFSVRAHVSVSYTTSVEDEDE